MLRRFLFLQPQRNLHASCTLLKAGAPASLGKQVKMMKKIMVGREKGKRRFIFNESLPKLEVGSKMSQNKGQGKESKRRITVLNKLFMKNITDLMATDNFSQGIMGYGIQVSVVKISPDFNSVNVFWIAQGDENDAVVEQVLKSISGPLRHELSQLRIMGEVPRIYFVKDKFYSKAAEVDILLKTADYGEDFVPSDPTVFMKASPQLNVHLSDEVRARIYELEQEENSENEIEDEELPIMKNDVLGLDHAAIMKKIAVSIDRSKKAWETFGTHNDSIMHTSEPLRDFSALNVQVDKLNREAHVRNEFVKFLEQKQYERKVTPERKRNKDLNPQNDSYDYVDDNRDSNYEDDFLEDDQDPKK